MRLLAVALVAVLAGCAAPSAPDAALPPAAATVTLPYAAAACTTVNVVRFVPLETLAPHVPGHVPREAAAFDAAAPAGTGAVAFEATSCPGLEQTVTAILVAPPEAGLGRAFNFVEVARDVRGAAPFAEAGWPAGEGGSDVRVAGAFFGLARSVHAETPQGDVAGTAYGARESGTTTRVWRDLDGGAARLTTTTTGRYALLAPTCEFPPGSPMHRVTGETHCAGARGALATGLAWDGALVAPRVSASG